MILTPGHSVGPLLDLDIFDNQEVTSLGAPGTLGDLQRQNLTALTPELKDVLPFGVGFSVQPHHGPLGIICTYAYVAVAFLPSVKVVMLAI
ncbi:hypothetical protein HJC05_05585 [Rhizobium sp. NLR9a]|uniref:hypothetical protein n=1 Tax=Rhizobium sp. NLR9a TaxID=2731120 RepID=UPI001C82A474|nr:hypothetical protein [Rhizobium sp. NLR9a]MBX5213708.1 hypothetical protein [Rhizobium sp. NLR9a]